MRGLKQARSTKCCYGYVRVSTTIQVETGHSLEEQERKIRAWADLNDMKIMGIYIDKGVSGTFMFQRPEFGKMVSLIQRGDTLVANDLSRVSRNLLDIAKLMELLEERGAHAVFISDGFNTSTEMGKMMIGISSMIKQMETRQSSERITDTLALMKDKGQSLGRPPYGWTKISTDPGSPLVEVPEEQAIISRIKQLKENGSSFTGIAKLLTNEGITTPSGKSLKWDHSTIKNIITRGEVAVKGRYDK